MEEALADEASRASGRLSMTLARLLRHLEAQRVADDAEGSGTRGRAPAAKDEDAMVLDERTLVVIDEAAMVDLPIIYRQLGYMNRRGRLLLLGDGAQLAPIGFGLVYHRPVENLETTARLTVVPRQTGVPGIPAVAASIRAREMPVMVRYSGKTDGVSFVETSNDAIAQAVERISDDLGGVGRPDNRHGH
jgi:exodeoxyribonuclease V alpha subunit